MKQSKTTLSLFLVCVFLFSSFALSSCQSDASGYKIPIVCGESGMNDVCGIATYGVNYYNLGVRAGDMAADVLLEGADISAMAVQSDPNPALSINTAVAGELGFTIPDSVASAAGDDTTLSVKRVESAIVSAGADFTVGILQLVQHVALDSANKGFQDQLSVRMAAAGKTVSILNENASNEQANNITIAETFVSKKVDLIYTIATSSSQAAAAATTEIPVIFNAVTNPIDAGLVASVEKPGANVSGVSDINPVADQIALIGKLLGKEEITVGLLYTSAEINSVFQIDLAKKACDEMGYQYVTKGIGDMNDIESAFVALKNVDAIFIPTDNVLANGASIIHSINREE